ncbi:unnamed protein product [Rhizophagus irregularis]|uniref:Uncharacterized protein n=1 Tax=Rhizophagus irregularis (strain DAOM 181602 / DAOM 197198 / MUCL 43194) TaxID=747089 RepID=A0A2P4QCQ3_RHIID|nr:hypothetical protein GLOIN_2v985889 [Rhizophagus irregularis DAOM 181602=DAOM 197198]POG75402.1 hypothetical protein GLOIN_2v985889 [Rhizophagus irregularis DAOM 181602=DAOM 197198]CAB4398654.1 unnamed protein product [Rhizophagus irregularis]CAB4424087.1 unnamed protein product [Rhizophagus irregularis]CAB5342302.1 unnamed protein product [Rhizophagus irregularis]|eukprot:XP_025182268.1 hypothetical protein GLOIN_2v985889 [Rhizophagus irregularis DAOM 181602=DAOM 197198]
MKDYVIIFYRIISALYFFTCVGTEIWYLISLGGIGDVYDYFYLLGNIILIVIFLFVMRLDWENLEICFCASYYIQLIMLLIILIRSIIGDYPFNCNFQGSNNVKIACKVRLFIGTFSLLIPLLPFLGYKLYFKSNGIFNFIKSDILVL